MTIEPRFEISPDVPLRPFAIAGPEALGHLSVSGVEVLDALEPANAEFVRAMNRANCLAYDGQSTPGIARTALGMPPWVMLDCCLLPSVVFGFSLPRVDIPSPIADAMDPGRGLERIGVSEYIALPTLSPGEVVGVSLFSLVAGQALGRRTKALALRVLGARRQIGVTQYTSAGVKLHLAFGPLDIISTQVPVHNRPAETFVYSLNPPAPSELAVLAEGGEVAWKMPEGEHWELDPREGGVAESLDEVLGERRAVLVGASPHREGGLDRLHFVLVDE